MAVILLVLSAVIVVVSGPVAHQIGNTNEAEVDVDTAADGAARRGKFKYGDSNPVEHRQRVIGYLEQRDHRLDTGAVAQQRRRLAAIGDWRTHRNQT